MRSTKQYPVCCSQIETALLLLYECLQTYPVLAVHHFFCQGHIYVYTYMYTLYVVYPIYIYIGSLVRAAYLSEALEPVQCTPDATHQEPTVHYHCVSSQIRATLSSNKSSIDTSSEPAWLAWDSGNVTKTWELGSWASSKEMMCSAAPCSDV